LRRTGGGRIDTRTLDALRLVHRADEDGRRILATTRHANRTEVKDVRGEIVLAEIPEHARPGLSSPDWRELVGREFGERASAAVGRADKLDQVSLGRFEDVDDGAGRASPQTVLRQVTAKPDAIKFAVAAGLLPARGG
jgi:hypothetical protein